ncbi:Clcn1 [Symbiodinium sp. CCMP2592]|nr:Clcn1 [Symbiodinium sp. CCMP2592]
MGGKAKPTKHTAKELAQKEKDATCNRGGGSAGLKDRQGGSVGHSKYKCNICMQSAPDPKSMQMHFESKHPKEEFALDKCTDLHSGTGGTTQGASPTTKTPLSRMARLFRKGTSAVVQDDAHYQRCEDLQKEEKHILRRFWILLFVTAILSSSLSFLIDRFTYGTGLLRSTLTLGAPLKALGFNVGMACLARLIVRPTVEAEGSGFPEMKAMLFGKVLFNFLTFRVLVAKALALSLGVGAGLPLGKEGPNVHMAACIARVIHPSFFEKRVQSSHGAHGAGGSGVGSAVSKLLLAACAVGVGASFSAPIGGVIFSLELMLPQTYDAFAYWGCFTAGIVGAITYAVERTLTTGSASLLPLISSNVLPGEGSDTDFPLLRLAVDIVLGLLCGLAGGIWVRCHSYVAGVLKRWRLREGEPLKASGQEQPLLGGQARAPGCLKRCFLRMLGGKWRDLALVASVTALNTVLASSLPLLGGKPQPLLISTIFDKNLMQKDPEAWVLPWAGVAGTMALCFLMKWCMTILALSSAIPAGVVAPTMIIGGLLGRVYAHVLLPDWFIDLLLSKDGLPPSELQRGAFMARCGIVGASAFCAAVCRAFAMAITVFEVLALPNSVLPLCSSALTAIFVANKVSLPFFDANLATRNLGGIPAITFTDKAIEPVMKVMTVADMSECLPQMLTLRHLLHVLTSTKHDFFPIVRPLAWDVSDKGLLEGTMTRKNVEPHACGKYKERKREREREELVPQCKFQKVYAKRHRTRSVGCTESPEE